MSNEQTGLLSLEQLRAKTKPELVAYAMAELALTLNANDNKDELLKAIADAQDELGGEPDAGALADADAVAAAAQKKADDELAAAQAGDIGDAAAQLVAPKPTADSRVWIRIAEEEHDKRAVFCSVNDDQVMIPRGSWQNVKRKHVQVLLNAEIDGVPRYSLNIHEGPHKPSESTSVADAVAFAD